jgi:hypothetical protein
VFLASDSAAVSVLIVRYFRELVFWIHASAPRPNRTGPSIFQIIADGRLKALLKEDIITGNKA